jgi:hypothetical protein
VGAYRANFASHRHAAATNFKAGGEGLSLGRRGPNQPSEALPDARDYPRKSSKTRSFEVFKNLRSFDRLRDGQTDEGRLYSDARQSTTPRSEEDRSNSIGTARRWSCRVETDADRSYPGVDCGHTRYPGRGELTSERIIL